MEPDTVPPGTSPEDELLYRARNGQAKIIHELLTKRNLGVLELDINCKGKNKANHGWSPLHLAAYFGHKDVVNLLLENGADVNIINNVGDTPLHRGAFTGRLDVVMLLLGANADVSVVNAEGQTPKRAARNPEIKTLIEAAEKFEERKAEEVFLDAARNGDCETVSQLLKRRNPVNVNCTDMFGNTALHGAAYRGNTEVAVLLLQSGIDTTIKNCKGQLAEDMARQTQVKQLLGVKPIKELKKSVLRFEGAVLKRSRLLGWKPVWLVVERGVLSVFRDRGDASTGSRRKSVKYLDDAKVMPKNDTAHMFVVQFSDHTTYTFCVDPNTQASVNRQKWEIAVNEHIAYSNYYTQQGTAISDEEELDELVPLGSMGDTLQTAQAHQNVLENQVADVTRTIDNLSADTATDTTVSTGHQQVTLAKVQQQLTQILSSSREMSGSLSQCLTIFTQQEELRKIQLQQETEKSRVLQDAIHILAEEHHELERSLGHRSPSVMYDSDNDDEFYECSEGSKPGLSSSYQNGSNNILSQVQLPDSTCSNTNGTAEVETEKSCWGSRFEKMSEEVEGV